MDTRRRLAGGGAVDDSEADTRAVWIQDLNDPADELHELVPASHAEWEFVGADERGLIMRTDLDAAARPAGAGGPATPAS